MKAILLKIRRDEWNSLLGLKDTRISQITVDKNGEVYFLLESEKFHLLPLRGQVPHTNLADFRRKELEK